MLNEKKLLEKTESEIKKYGIMKKSFKSIYDSEMKLLNKRKDAFLTIKNLKEKDNTFLSDIYVNFVDQMIELENYRQKLTTTINKKIIPATEYYPDKAKKVKQNIGNYSNIKKTQEKQKSERIKAASNSQAEKAKNLQLEINRNQNLMNQTGQTIEKDLLIFENERIVDNKYLFLHFIHSELGYHAQALEKLSNLFAKIHDIYPIEDLPNFVHKYNLNNSGDLSDFGYNKKDIERQKKRNQNLDAGYDNVSNISGNINNSQQGMINNPNMNKSKSNISANISNNANIQASQQNNNQNNNNILDKDELDLEV